MSSPSGRGVELAGPVPLAAKRAAGWLGAVRRDLLGLTRDALPRAPARRSYARQCLVSRGLLPFLATPNSGEGLLEDAVKHAASLGLVGPLDHVVVVQRVHDDFCVKIVSVAPSGRGILRDDEEVSSLSKSNSLKHMATLAGAVA